MPRAQQHRHNALRASTRRREAVSARCVVPAATWARAARRHVRRALPDPRARSDRRRQLDAVKARTQIRRARQHVCRARRARSKAAASKRAARRATPAHTAHWARPLRFPAPRDPTRLPQVLDLARSARPAPLGVPVPRGRLRIKYALLAPSRAERVTAARCVRLAHTRRQQARASAQPARRALRARKARQRRTHAALGRSRRVPGLQRALGARKAHTKGPVARRAASRAGQATIARRAREQRCHALLVRIRTRR